MRTGSYPLMNLAQDFGVDYGDVLLVTQALRENTTMSRARHQQAAKAGLRIQKLIGSTGYGRLIGKIVEHL